MKENFVKNIRGSFNLNEYEAKIWISLLSKGVATAGELAEISNVPRSRCYDVLESLEKRGYIVMKLGKPIKYLAVEPKEVIERVKKNINRSAKDKIEMVSGVEKTPVYTELALLYKNGVTHIDSSTISGAIKGRENLLNHAKCMIKKAKDSVVIVTTEKGLSRKVDSLGYVLKKLSDMGVKVKIVAPSNDKELVDSLKKFAEFKKIDSLNSRFVIVDSKEILFMLNGEDVHDAYDIGVWSNTSLFAKAVNDLFEFKWNS